MRRVFRVLLLFAVLAAGALPFSVAQAQTPIPPAVCGNVTAASGAAWRVCTNSVVPPVGGLVVFAHGYVPFYAPVAIPEDQLQLGGTYLPDLITSMGFAFATTSYPQNGLAILEGVTDIQALTAFARPFAQANLPNGFLIGSRTYLTGVSEGGLVTALAIERDTANQFSGGLAACGPIGSFQKQANYFGDFRVLFDYYFAPGLTGPLYMQVSPIWISPLVPGGFESNFALPIAGAMAGNPGATTNLIATSGAAIDIADSTSPVKTATGILWYSYYATNDARDKLAKAGKTPGADNNFGNPFDNRKTVYRNPLSLGAVVPVSERFREDPIAGAKLGSAYQTTGEVNKPLVTLHTILDPIVPFWHEVLYYKMAREQGDAANVTPIPVQRYGHCAFTAAEVAGAFGILVQKVTGSQPALLKSQPFDLSRAASDFDHAQAEAAKHPALR